jgi:hypothetical protein
MGSPRTGASRSKAAVTAAGAVLFRGLPPWGLPACVCGTCARVRARNHAGFAPARAGSHDVCPWPLRVPCVSLLHVRPATGVCRFTRTCLCPRCTPIALPTPLFGAGAATGPVAAPAPAFAPATNTSGLTHLDVSHTFLDVHGVDALVAALCSLSDASALLEVSPARLSTHYTRVYDFAERQQGLEECVADFDEG